MNNSFIHLINILSSGYEQDNNTFVNRKSLSALKIEGCSLLDGANNNKNLLKFKNLILKKEKPE
jgi:hypothetical protein